MMRGHGQDFALGVNGLEYLMKAEQEGRITTGHVVLAQANGILPEVIAAEKATVVHERLCNYVPRDGQLGKGWDPIGGFTADFMPATTMKRSPNAPF